MRRYITLRPASTTAVRMFASRMQYDTISKTLRFMLFTHISCTCPSPVRQRESRQLTAAGQSQTLTPECQPQTRPGPNGRATTAGQWYNLKNVLIIYLFIHLFTYYINNNRQCPLTGAVREYDDDMKLEAELKRKNMGK